MFAWGDKDYLEQISMDYRQVPTDFRLDNPYPNPFNPTVTVKYEVPKATKVNAVVYNVLGKKVKTLAINQAKDMGYHQFKWHGVNELNDQVASGIYFLKMSLGSKQFTKKLILIK